MPDAIELLIHPVRLRIVYAMAGGRVLSSSDLRARLPDVSKATLYRHIGQLADAGVLEVASERRARGAVERLYRLREDRTLISAEAAATISTEDHRRAFAASVAAIMAEFSAYLDREGANPTADSVSYRQFTLWLSPAEVAGLIAKVRGVLMAPARHAPSPGRTPHLLSTILFPIGPRSPGAAIPD
ncbi:MAG TPA: helix-turn-helix domain-containing protein [Gemmatimonadales bacterium]